MATIITVHGTNDSGPEVGDQWWQKSSYFDSHIRQLVDAGDDELNVEPLIWDGRNSESSRRAAATALCKVMAGLEARGEAYSIIGHSHGGTIIAAALVDTVVNRQKTDGLKSWITVGSPFVQLRKERLLFSRIPTYQKSIFVGFFALLMMFLTMLGLRVLYGSAAEAGAFFGSGSGPLFDNVLRVFMLFLSFSGVFLLFYGVLYFFDARKFRVYRKSAMREADRRFSPIWVSFCHDDDEAVQGLKSLGTVKAPIFHKDFAIPLFASVSVFVLPLLYFLIVFSPGASSWVTRVITKNIYFNPSYGTIDEQIKQKQAVIGAAREEQWKIVGEIMPGFQLPRREWKRGGESQVVQSQPGDGKAVEGQTPQGTQSSWRSPADRSVLDQFGERQTSEWWRRDSMTDEQREARRQQWVQRRQEIEAKATPAQRERLAAINSEMRKLFNEVRDLRRVAAFKKNFLDDQGQLVFGGRNPAKNSELVFRIFTTEVENLFKDLFDDRIIRRSWWIEVGALALIVVAMPLLFAAFSLAILLGFRFLAYRLSGRISGLLDQMTWGELRRAAFGNDTIAEVALGAHPHPAWSSVSKGYLPEGIAQEISARSNDVAFSSLARLRNAISELAFSERGGDHARVVEEYITWHELIHTTYFHVPRFRKLVAYALVQVDGGFTASKAFQADPDYTVVAGWYDDIGKAGRSLQSEGGRA